MRRSKHIVGLLAGTAMRMTPLEQRMGRFMRSPDGHDAGGAAAPAAAPANEPTEAPTAAPVGDSAPAAPAKPSTNAMDAFEAEFGAVDLSGSGEDDGEGDPASAAEEPKPGVSEPEPKDDPAAQLEAERERANRLEAELREARKGKEPAKDDATPQTPQESDPAPNPDDYEFGEADSKYISDNARWSARQEFRQMEARKELQTELSTIEDGWKTNTGSEEFKAEYPDFDQVVIKGGEDQAWDCTPLMALAIKASDVGGHVAYDLAKNPAEATRIAKLIPVEQAFEMGIKIGAQRNRISAKKSTSEIPAAPAKVASSAPPPPAQRSRGSGGQYVSEMNSMQDRMLKEFR